MSFPAYPAYKESGQQWIGCVPQSWQCRQVSYIFGTISSGTTPPTDAEKYYDGDICWVTTGELRESIITDTEKRVTHDAIRELSALKVYPPGTLLIALYGATIGRVGILGVNACTNQACCALAHPTSFEISFAYYCLIAVREHLLVIASGGGQPNINQDKIRALRLPVPPHDEQFAIASFLDHETAKIDALVAEQERLIALLKEKRQAVISHAVTKGLDPNAPMKDSGVEWLGQVPVDWTIVKLEHITEITAGFAFDSSLFGFDGIPVIRMSDFGEGRLFSDDAKRVFPEHVPSKSYAQAGDVILGLSGSINNFAVVNEEDMPVAINQRIAILRCRQDVQKFILYYIMGGMFVNQIVADLPETTIQNVSMGQVRGCRLALPPAMSIQQIVSVLDRDVDQINVLTTEASHAITLLRERRAALISAAVTGKIDVRGVIAVPAAEAA